MDQTTGQMQTVVLPYEKQGEYNISPVNIKPKPIYQFCKRTLDILVSGTAISVLFLPMVLIALLIKTHSKGTVFFCQDRLGLNGKKIRIIKFRSMYMDAEKNGAQWAAGDDDPRITPIGRYLRLSRLDELPQLWNIFVGDMSFVGPRPERECFYREFETYIHGFSERLKVKPGLTGLAQVNGGYDLRPEQKIIYDVEYMNKRSFWFDLKIILKTILVVLFRRGAR